MKYIVFDIETTNFFPDVGSNKPEDLDLAVVCIYTSETESYICYEKEELNDLWPLIEQTDMLIGYNSDHFDIPLLNKYYHGDITKVKSLDLMKEVQKVLGRRIKLDTIAEATLGEGKSAHGSMANIWWRQGKKQEVKDYCVQDVKVTKDIYQYALDNGHVKYIDMVSQESLDIELDTSTWNEKEDGGMTASLF